MKEIIETHQQKGVVSSDEYYTPKHIIEALGHFDLDPATPENTTEVRKNIRRMLGLSRPNRGKFLSGTQVYSRHVHYLKKLKK